MSDDPKPPAVVTAAVTPQPIPEGFSIPGVVALARDLAMEMYDEPVLLKKHGISEAQYATLKTVPYFINTLKSMAEEWHGTTNSQQRLAMQTSIGLEEVLPDVIARAKVKNEPLQGVAQLVKVLAEICGAAGSNRQQAPASERFKITINLGADTEVFEKSKPVITVEAESAPQQVQSQPQGFGSLLTLQTEPETP